MTMTAVADGDAPFAESREAARCFPERKDVDRPGHKGWTQRRRRYFEACCGTKRTEPTTCSYWRRSVLYSLCGEIIRT